MSIVHYDDRLISKGSGTSAQKRLDKLTKAGNFSSTGFSQLQNASIAEVVAVVPQWLPMLRFNFFKSYQLIDGTTYRGFRQLYSLITADGHTEYRLMSEAERQQEAKDLHEW